MRTLVAKMAIFVTLSLCDSRPLSAGVLQSCMDFFAHQFGWEYSYRTTPKDLRAAIRAIKSVPPRTLHQIKLNIGTYALQLSGGHTHLPITRIFNLNTRFPNRIDQYNFADLVSAYLNYRFPKVEMRGLWESRYDLIKKQGEVFVDEAFIMNVTPALFALDIDQLTLALHMSATAGQIDWGKFREFQSLFTQFPLANPALQMMYDQATTQSNIDPIDLFSAVVAKFPLHPRIARIPFAQLNLDQFPREPRVIMRSNVPDSFVRTFLAAVSSPSDSAFANDIYRKRIRWLVQVDSKNETPLAIGRIKRSDYFFGEFLPFFGLSARTLPDQDSFAVQYLIKLYIDLQDIPNPNKGEDTPFFAAFLSLIDITGTDEILITKSGSLASLVSLLKSVPLGLEDFYKSLKTAAAHRTELSDTDSKVDANEPSLLPKIIDSKGIYDLYMLLSERGEQDSLQNLTELLPSYFNRRFSED